MGVFRSKCLSVLVLATASHAMLGCSSSPEAAQNGQVEDEVEIGTSQDAVHPVVIGAIVWGVGCYMGHKYNGIGNCIRKVGNSARALFGWRSESDLNLASVDVSLASGDTQLDTLSVALDPATQAYCTKGNLQPKAAKGLCLWENRDLNLKFKQVSADTEEAVVDPRLRIRWISLDEILANKTVTPDFSVMSVYNSTESEMCLYDSNGTGRRLKPNRVKNFNIQLSRIEKCP